MNELPFENSQQDDAFASLEAELRQMPRPSVPSDLQAKLLATIPQRSTDLPATVTTHRSHRWGRRVRGLAAAAAMIVVGVAALWMVQRSASPRPIELTEAQIDEQIEREGTAAKLYAAAQILEASPGGKPYADDSYRYLVSKYSDTQVGRDLIRRRIAQ